MRSAASTQEEGEKYFSSKKSHSAENESLNPTPHLNTLQNLIAYTNTLPIIIPYLNTLPPYLYILPNSGRCPNTLLPI